MMLGGSSVLRRARPVNDYGRCNPFGLVGTCRDREILRILSVQKPLNTNENGQPALAYEARTGCL